MTFYHELTSFPCRRCRSARSMATFIITPATRPLSHKIKARIPAVIVLVSTQVLRPRFPPLFWRLTRHEKAPTSNAMYPPSHANPNISSHRNESHSESIFWAIRTLPRREQCSSVYKRRQTHGVVQCGLRKNKSKQPMLEALVRP